VEFLPGAKIVADSNSAELIKSVNCYASWFIAGFSVAPLHLSLLYFVRVDNNPRLAQHDGIQLP